MDRSKPLFSQEDLNKTFIIDDQYLAISDKENLLMSKKFLMCAFQAPFANNNNRQSWFNFQYPLPPGVKAPHGEQDAIMMRNY